ncbi:MAG: hypothetical protein IPP30_00240 [Flavobacterium sp.]|nr:hypothetical protein [Flavobacterium sp.]
MSIYDGIYIFDENKLDSDFTKKYKDRLVRGSRGYGYWCWKPQIILQAFELMNEGDVLQYTDIGCHLNPKGRPRLEEYFNITKCSENGILAFTNKVESELLPNEIFYDYDDLNYTKMDLSGYFGIADNITLLKKPQFGSGIIFFRKDAKTIQFVEDWSKVYATDFKLVDDTPSVIPNHPSFIEHRHDQSIFSLLCKLTGVEELYATEYFTPGDWNDLSSFPVWAKRDKKIPWIQKEILKIRKIKNKVISFLTMSK